VSGGPKTADLAAFAQMPPEQEEDSIMRAASRDHEGLISLFCLVARKR
jgi:hypothetical protein